MKLSRDELFRLATLAWLRLSATWAVHRGGVVALSDDDYARIVIAQELAASPKLDPSGTSWLPFPFWVTGSFMRLGGGSLEVARMTQALLSIAAIWLLYAGGRIAGMSARTAYWGAAFASILPLSLLLGAATVPELPTAALSAFSLLALSRRTPNSGLLAGFAILPATLSRYEAWPIAAVVALFSMVDAFTTPPPSPALPAPRGKGARIAGGLLAMLGPVAWILWNQNAHGDALHFLRRVSAYREALGIGAEAWGGYLLAVATGCLTISLPLVWIFVLAKRAKLDALQRWKRPAAGALAILAFLLLGALLGGAPTHHPERTLLAVWLLGALALVDGLRELRWPPLHVQGLKANAMVVGFALLVAAGVLWDTHQGLDGLAHRGEEERVGRALRELVPEGERVLVATEDYGYFAVMAAFGRPWDVVVDRTHDPRAGREESALRDAGVMAEKGARFVVAEELPEGVRGIGRWGRLWVGGVR